MNQQEANRVSRERWRKKIHEGEEEKKDREVAWIGETCRIQSHAVHYSMFAWYIFEFAVQNQVEGPVGEFESIATDSGPVSDPQGEEGETRASALLQL